MPIIIVPSRPCFTFACVKEKGCAPLNRIFYKLNVTIRFRKQLLMHWSISYAGQTSTCCETEWDRESVFGHAYIARES